jgi:hypothetical protein
LLVGSQEVNLTLKMSTPVVVRITGGKLKTKNEYTCCFRITGGILNTRNEYSWS